MTATLHHRRESANAVTTIFVGLDIAVGNLQRQFELGELETLWLVTW